MKKMLAISLGLMAAACVIAVPVWAQGIPVAPAAGAVPVDAATAATVAAPTKNIFTMLLPSADQCAACKVHFCRSPLGQMVSNMTKPISLATGGLISSRCPQALTANDLKKPADSAQGAAARVMQDEAEAKERRNAVRILGTVDCRRWPEAEDALINALRTDRNECVRMEAAYVLGRGCCCTKRTMEALTLTVSGSDKDNNPVEYSERVRATAAVSLNNCLSCYVDVTPVEVKEGDSGVPKELPRPKELPKDGGLDTQGAGEYYKNIDKLSKAEVIRHARQALGLTNGQTQSTPPPASAPRISKGGVIEIIQNAFAPNQPTQSPTADRMVTPAVAMQPSYAPSIVQPAQFPMPTPPPPAVIPVVTPSGTPVHTPAAQPVAQPAAPSAVTPLLPMKIDTPIKPVGPNTVPGSVEVPTPSTTPGVKITQPFGETMPPPVVVPPAVPVIESKSMLPPMPVTESKQIFLPPAVPTETMPVPPPAPVSDAQRMLPPALPTPVAPPVAPAVVSPPPRVDVPAFLPPPPPMPVAPAPEMKSTTPALKVPDSQSSLQTPKTPTLLDTDPLFNPQTVHSPSLENSRAEAKLKKRPSVQFAEEKSLLPNVTHTTASSPIDTTRQTPTMLPPPATVQPAFVLPTMVPPTAPRTTGSGSPYAQSGPSTVVQPMNPTAVPSSSPYAPLVTPPLPAPYTVAKVTPPPSVPAGFNTTPAVVVPASSTLGAPTPSSNPNGAPALAAPTLEYMLHYLREGSVVEERQRAATQLTLSSWSHLPEVRRALTTAAQTDPSQAVRGTCQACLGRLKAQ